jgi:RNA polymerase sigma factor (TIGR02999 family)
MTGSVSSRLEPSDRVTELLRAWTGGDEAALPQLVPLVLDELRRLARQHITSKRDRELLQTTALVNEAYLRLVDITRVRWQDRNHFFSMASRLMRRVLVDLARAHTTAKRGGGQIRVTLDEAVIASEEPGPDLLALDEALEALASVDVRKSRVIEMRFFGGLSVEETAEALNVSPQTVMRDWRLARAWLSRELRRKG